jgi:membrane fusion protein (multidrug efflux system)
MNVVTRPPAPEVVAGSSQTPRRRWRVLRMLALLVLLLTAALLGNWWIVEGRWLESTDNAYVQGDIAVLSARIEGDVATINVADNQAVRTGDALISLDPADWSARLDQARGAAAEAFAAVGTAKRQVEQSRTAIAQAEALMDQASAELTRATAEANRSGTLVGAGWTSRQANEQAVADQLKAQAQLAAARAQRETAQQALAVAEAQVPQAEAHAITAEAAARLAANNLSYTLIRAPFDGVVGNRAAQLGQHVQAGQQLIALAPATSRLYVVANYKETQLRRMRPGQRAWLTPDIDTSAVVPGRVDSLAPATGALFSLLPPENATGNFTKIVQRVPVKIVIDPAAAESAGWLRAGLSVVAEVDTREHGGEKLGLFAAAAASLGLK